MLLVRELCITFKLYLCEMTTKKSPLDGYAESGLVMKFWLKVQADFFDQAVF